MDFQFLLDKLANYPATKWYDKTIKDLAADLRALVLAPRAGMSETVYISSSEGDDRFDGQTTSNPMATISAALDRYYARGVSLTLQLRAGDSFDIGAFSTFNALKDVKLTRYGTFTTETVTVASVGTAPAAGEVTEVDLTGFTNTWGLNELAGVPFTFENGQVGWISNNDADVAGTVTARISAGDSNVGLTNPSGETLEVHVDGVAVRTGSYTLLGPDENFGFLDSKGIEIEWAVPEPDGVTVRALLLEGSDVRFNYCYFGPLVQRVALFKNDNYCRLQANFFACGATGNFGALDFAGSNGVIRVDGGNVFRGAASSSYNAVGSNIEGLPGCLLILAGRAICDDVDHVLNMASFQVTLLANHNANRAFVMINHKGTSAPIAIADTRNTRWVNGPLQLPTLYGSTAFAYTLVAARNASRIMLGQATLVTDGTGTNTVSADGGSSICSGDVRLGTRILTQEAERIHDVSTSGTAVGINVLDGDSFEVDLQAATGNVTLTITNPVKYGEIWVRFTQGSTARQITSWSGGVDVFWDGGTPPTLSATNDAVDVFRLYHDGTRYIGQVVAQAAA